ncbi:MAG: alpha-L-glutamate ligase-like protein [Paracoccaceae bacterium]
MIFGLASPAALRRAGVIGMNGRNARYVADCNPQRAMPQVNDKLVTKRIAEEAGVPVPRLWGVVEIQAQVKDFERLLDGHEDFVIKPSLGAQGDGIMVVAGRHPKGWQSVSGAFVSEKAIRFHLSNVLSGMYSLNGLSDVAMLEERVVFSDVFDAVAYKGVPDIRIIVYRGVPIMAMARVPTRASDGKANLHKGGVGLGIDIATGRTTSAVCRDQVIREHPDTGLPIEPIDVPDWRDMLMMGSVCTEPTGLGYLGVDLVIDERRGPLLLELNARPGLAVQLANAEGMQSRLDAVDANDLGRLTARERVAYAMDHFGGCVGATAETTAQAAE